MVEGNRVPTEDEITPPGRDVVAENNVDAADAALREDYRRTVGFQPQDGTDQRTQVAGYDRSLGYDRVAVGNTAMGQRIDNITNLLAMGERSAGNLQDVNRYYGRAQKEADDLFSVAAQNVMKGREDYRAILSAKSPEEVFQGVNQSIQKQAQALQLQLQQEQDPARQRRLAQLLDMEQDRALTLERMQSTKNSQELDRLLMYDAFSAQRIDLGQKMLNERDPNQVRLMAEAEMNLHTVQRAPGFTRANYGMLMMRLGQYDPNRPDNAALRALQDAASVDPEMVPNSNSKNPARRMGDPNFMRVAADIIRMSPDDPRFGQVMAPIFNRDINRSPAQTYATGDQTVNPNARYAQVQDQPFQPAMDGTGNRDKTVVADRSQGVTPLVNGKTPFQRVQELAQVANQQGLTPDVRKAYESCVLDSDKGTSPRVAELQTKLAQLEQKQQQIAQQIDAIQKDPAIQTLVQQGMAKLKARPEAEQQQLKTLTEQLQKTQNKEERDAILAKIGQVCPEFVQVTRLLEEKLKPFTDQLQEIQKQGEALSNDLIGELNQSSATRMEYAEKLMKSDKPEDKALAKQLLIESVAKAKPEQREAFAQYAMQLGLSQQELQQGLAKLPPQEVQNPAAQTGDQTQVVSPSGERTGAGKLIDENKKAFDAAQDKKAKLAEMQGSFQKAIVDADKELTDAETTYNQLDAARTKALNDMPADDKAKLQKLLTEGTPQAEKQALQQELAGKYASLDQMALQMQSIQNGAVYLALNKFEARYEFARASSLGGDDANAKKLMEDGIKTLTKDVGPEVVGKVLEDPGVGELVKKYSLDANALMQAAIAEAPKQTGDQTQVAGTGAGDLQGTLRVANSRMQKGDIAGAKEAYESAIKMVDATFKPEENNAKIKAAQDALEAGNLTPDQRMAKHQEIASYFNQAYQAFDIRSGYARVLAHPSYNQNKAAEAAFKDAIAAADRVPVEAMKRHVGILANDVGTFQTALEQAPAAQKAKIEEQQAFLSEFVNTLNGQTTGGGPAADKAWMNTQINARKDLASFYVRLVTDIDEKGQPLLKADGTPRYVPDASQVFKPEDGMKAIDDAKAKYKALYGVDLDADPAKDPTLAILQKGIYDNSPAELQKKYQNVTRFWDEAKASIPTILAGVGTAIALSKFKPVAGLIRAEASLGSKALGWGTALTAGSTAASLTHHTMMNNVLGRTDNTWGNSIAIGTGYTLGGVGLIKVPNFLFRNLTTQKGVGMVERAGMGTMKVGDDFVALKVLRTQADDLIKAGGVVDDGLKESIRLRVDRTAAFNLGNKGTLIDDFDAVFNAAKTGGERARLLDGLGAGIKNSAGELAISRQANVFAKTVADRGGLLVKDPKIIASLESKGIEVATINGERVVKFGSGTVGEAKTMLQRVAFLEPRALGAKNLKGVQPLMDDLSSLATKGIDDSANLAEVLKTANLEDKALVNILRAVSPEASVAASQATKFGGVSEMAAQGLLSKSYKFATGKIGAPAIGATYGLGSEGYDAATGGEFSFKDAATKSVLVAGGLYGGGKVGEFGFGVLRPMGSKTLTQVGHSRFMAGAAGGATFYSGSHYLPSWQHMYGENSIDPSTGKPYEFNFSNAIVKPAWKDSTDNIFISSFLLGGFAAKPGQALLAQAPWANSRLLMKPLSGAGGLFTGSTWNYLGSRSMPLLGEVGPALSTNIALGQFELMNNWSNRGAGVQYTDALKKTGEEITDESPEAIQKRIQQAQQAQQQQQQQQQQQKQQPAKTPVEQGPVNQPRQENPDLTGGVQ
jgi:hypothetical protein